MTCIVALKDGNKIYMSCDSQSSSGSWKGFSPRPKIFRPVSFALLGVSGCVRVADIIQNSKLEYNSIFSLTESIRDNLGDFGCITTENGTDSMEANILLVFEEKIVTIHKDFSAQEDSRDFAAIGCGEEYALGSLFSTVNKEPLDRVHEAIHAANHFSPHCGGRIHTEILSAR